jgi:hypothetical protein
LPSMRKRRANFATELQKNSASTSGRHRLPIRGTTIGYNNEGGLAMPLRVNSSPGLARRRT